jgi:hypothetical protein
VGGNDLAADAALADDKCARAFNDPDWANMDFTNKVSHENARAQESSKTCTEASRFDVSSSIEAQANKLLPKVSKNDTGRAIDSVAR